MTDYQLIRDRFETKFDFSEHFIYTINNSETFSAILEELHPWDLPRV